MDTPFDLAATDELLATTRAVRKRLDLERPVELEVLLECIDLAQQAPTGGNRQGWRFVVVTDAAQRQLIADTYRRVSQSYFASRAATPGDDQTSRVRSSSDYLRDNLERVPAMVIPCQQGRPESLPLAAMASYFGSIVPATWSMMLALRARGLGSVYTTLHLVDDGEQVVAQALGIPGGWTQTALIPVAYTIGTDFKPAKRPPVSDIVGVNGW